MATKRKFLIAGPLQRLARNPRHSWCASADVRKLDWTQWFSDGSMVGEPAQHLVYLHVRHVDGETWHRVWPRRPKAIEATAGVRLRMENGELYWLIDQPRTP